MNFILIVMTTFSLIFQNIDIRVERMIDHKDKMNTLRTNLEDYIKKQHGKIAVSFLIPGTNQYLGINDNVIFHAASTMKVPVMCELFRRVEADEIDLEDTVVVKNEFASIIDSSLYQLDIEEDSGDTLYSMIGKAVSIKFLIRDMITVSGNLSTNLLIEIIGAKNVQLLLNKIGAEEMKVLRGVEDIKAFRAGRNNVTSARALTKVFNAILNAQICSESCSNQMITVLKGQKFRDKIPARLPATVEVAHKTGSISGISHDAGIIYPSGKPPYVLSVLTSNFEDGDTAKGCIAEISKRIYDWYVLKLNN